jgi:hypothetical protein
MLAEEEQITPEVGFALSPLSTDNVFMLSDHLQIICNYMEKDYNEVAGELDGIRLRGNYRVSTHEPDLDNANVGSLRQHLRAEYLRVFRSF